MPTSTLTALDEARARHWQELLDETATRNGRWFDTEMDKLDRWAEDRRVSLKAELAELDDPRRPPTEPPHPLREYMGLGSWLLQDANWWADFPTTAAQAGARTRPRRRRN